MLAPTTLFCRFSSGEGKSKTAKLETEQIYGHCRRFQISVSLTRSTMWNCNQHRLYNEISVCRHSPDNSWQQRKGKPVRFLNFFSSSFNTSFRLSTRRLLHDVKVERQFLKAQKFNSGDKWSGGSSSEDRMVVNVKLVWDGFEGIFKDFSELNILKFR